MILEKINTEGLGKRSESVMEKKTEQPMESVLQEKKRELQLDKAFEQSNSVSFTDCTGSVPSAPATTEQWENYDESYHFQPEPASVRKKRKIFQ